MEWLLFIFQFSVFYLVLSNNLFLILFNIYPIIEPSNILILIANPNHEYLGAPNNCQGINTTGWEQLNNLVYLNSSKSLEHCVWSIISLFPKKSLLVSLCNDVPFVRITLLWDDQHIWEVDAVLNFFICWYWLLFWVVGALAHLHLLIVKSTKYGDSM